MALLLNGAGGAEGLSGVYGDRPGPVGECAELRYGIELVEDPDTVLKSLSIGLEVDGERRD